MNNLLAEIEGAPREEIDRFEFVNNGVALMTLDTNPEFFDSQMAVRARICTGDVDRLGDRIEPSGVYPVNWANSGAPILFEHGKCEVKIPIATAIDPEGNLAQEYLPEDDAIYSVAYFNQKIPTSVQHFELVREGFVRGASINVLPVGARTIRNSNGTANILVSDQVEWSWTVVPVNPFCYRRSLKSDSKIAEALNLQLDASTRILNRGTLGGEALLPSIARSLKAIQPPKAPTVRGHQVENPMNQELKTLSDKQVEALDLASLARALGSQAEYDRESYRLLVSRSKTLTTVARALGDEKAGESQLEVDDGAATVEATPVEEAPVEEAAVLPRGAEFVRNFHANLLSLVEVCENELKSVEKSEVVEGATAVCESLRASLAELEGLFASVYPEQGGLTAEAPEETVEEVMRSFRASHPRGNYQLLGHAASLEALASTKGLPDGARRSLVNQANLVRRWHSVARSFKDSQQEMVPKAQVDALHAKVKALHEKLALKPAPLPGQVA